MRADNRSSDSDEDQSDKGRKRGGYALKACVDRTMLAASAQSTVISKKDVLEQLTK